VVLCPGEGESNKWPPATKGKMRYVLTIPKIHMRRKKKKKEKTKKKKKKKKKKKRKRKKKEKKKHER